MKQALVILFTALLFTALTGCTNSSDTVWICENGITEVYHTKEECWALQNCKHQRNKTNVVKATDRDLRECKVCISLD